MPKEFVVLWSDSEKAGFVERLDEIFRLELTCDQALEFETSLNDSIYSLFIEA